MNHPCKRKTMAFLQALFFNRAKHLAGSPVKVSSLSKCFPSSPGANIPRIQKRMKDFLPSTSWADQFCFQSFMSRFGECNKSTILSNTRPLTQGRLKACQDLVFRSSACEGIFHGPLDSSKRPSTTSKRFAVVQKAIGTRSAIANKMCLFHLLRQKAITAIFWKRVSMAKDAPVKNHSITSRTVICEKFVAGMTWRFVSAKRLIRYLS